MVVEIGNIRFNNIEPGTDTTPLEAYQHALRHQELGEYDIKGAIINSTDGLVLLNDSPRRGVVGFHLRSLVCGCYGESAQYAASVLHLFSLDQESDAYGRLATRQYCEFPLH